MRKFVKAFTMIEVCIVVFILVILAMIVLPELHKRREDLSNHRASNELRAHFKGIDLETSPIGEIRYEWLKYIDYSGTRSELIEFAKLSDSQVREKFKSFLDGQ